MPDTPTDRDLAEAREQEQQDPCFGCASVTAERSRCPECHLMLCQECAESPDLYGYVSCCDIDRDLRDAISKAHLVGREAERRRARDAGRAEGDAAGYARGLREAARMLRNHPLPAAIERLARFDLVFIAGELEALAKEAEEKT